MSGSRSIGGSVVGRLGAPAARCRAAPVAGGSVARRVGRRAASCRPPLWLTGGRTDAAAPGSGLATDSDPTCGPTARDGQCNGGTDHPNDRRAEHDTPDSHPAVQSTGGPARTSSRPEGRGRPQLRTVAIRRPGWTASFAGPTQLRPGDVDGRVEIGHVDHHTPERRRVVADLGTLDDLDDEAAAADPVEPLTAVAEVADPFERRARGVGDGAAACVRANR